MNERPKLSRRLWPWHASRFSPSHMLATARRGTTSFPAGARATGRQPLASLLSLCLDSHLYVRKVQHPSMYPTHELRAPLLSNGLHRESNGLAA